MDPWIPATIFTAVNSLIGLAIAYAYLKYKVDDLIKNETVSKGAQEKANAKLEETIKDTIKEFHDSIKEDRRTLVEIAALVKAVSYTHLRAHETPEHLVCRLLL